MPFFSLVKNILPPEYGEKRRKVNWRTFVHDFGTDTTAMVERVGGTPTKQRVVIIELGDKMTIHTQREDYRSKINAITIKRIFGNTNTEPTYHLYAQETATHQGFELLLTKADE